MTGQSPIEPGRGFPLEMGGVHGDWAALLEKQDVRVRTTTGFGSEIGQPHRPFMEPWLRKDQVTSQESQEIYTPV